MTPDARVSRATAGSVRIRAVGAAFPMLRLPALGGRRGLGPGGGRGQTAVCAPDEDVLTLSAEAADTCPRVRRPRGRLRSTACGGERPGRRSPRARATRSSRPRSASNPTRAARCSPGRPTPGSKRCSARPTPSRPGSARTALVVAADALRPGIGTGFEARCRRRRRGLRPDVATAADAADDAAPDRRARDPHAPVPRSVPRRRRGRDP